MQKQYRNYRIAHDKTALISNLYSLLNSDFNNSEIIIETDAGILTVYPLRPLLSDGDYDIKKIEYEFGPGFILRKQGEIIDSFFVKVDEINIHYLKQGQPESERIIDDLTFAIVNDKKKIIFHCQKNYGADILMNVEKN